MHEASERGDVVRANQARELQRQPVARRLKASYCTPAADGLRMRSVGCHCLGGTGASGAAHVGLGSHTDGHTAPPRGPTVVGARRFWIGMIARASLYCYLSWSACWSTIYCSAHPPPVTTRAVEEKLFVARVGATRWRSLQTMAIARLCSLRC